MDPVTAELSRQDVARYELWKENRLKPSLISSHIFNAIVDELHINADDYHDWARAYEPDADIHDHMTLHAFIRSMYNITKIIDPFTWHRWIIRDYNIHVTKIKQEMRRRQPTRMTKRRYRTSNSLQMYALDDLF